MGRVVTAGPLRRPSSSSPASLRFSCPRVGALAVFLGVAGSSVPFILGVADLRGSLRMGAERRKAGKDGESSEEERSVERPRDGSVEDSRRRESRRTEKGKGVEGKRRESRRSERERSSEDRHRESRRSERGKSPSDRQPESRRSERERSVEDKNREDHRRSEREKRRDRDKHRDDRRKEKEKEREVERERSKEKEKVREREERERERERRKERERERAKEREERDRAREREREREKEKEREERERERARDKSCEKRRDLDGDEEKDSEAVRDHDRKRRRREEDSRDSEEGSRRKRNEEESDAMETEKTREEDLEEEQRKLDEEMDKRRRRVQEWQELRRKKEQEMEKNGAVNGEQHPEPGKRWTLEGDSDDDEALPSAKMEKDEALGEDSKPGDDEQDMAVDLVDATPANEGGAVDAEEEVDPLDAFMNSLQVPEDVEKPDASGMPQKPGDEEQNLDKGSMKKITNPSMRKKTKKNVMGRIIQGDESDSDYADVENDEVAVEDEDDDEFMKRVKKTKVEKLSIVDHSKIQYPPFRRNFYIEVKEISRMTPADVSAYRKELELKIHGKDVPKPVKTWNQTGLTSKVLDTIKKLNYEKPMPIQAQALPIIMSGRDCIGIAKTG